MPTIETIGESLYWSYANLAMAHAAVSKQESKYGRTHFMIRAKLFKGLKEQTMSLGSIADDERLKMILPQSCCYCGSDKNLSIDHLIPKAKGGTDDAENMIWACRSCNSSKNARDMLGWYLVKEEFPPLLLIRRYLKIAITFCAKENLLDTKIEDAPQLPFSLESVPHQFPKPPELRLWITQI
jgi:hypothetical protein